MTKDLRAGILDEARRLTMSDRSKSYGDVVENHRRIAIIWSVILGIRVKPSQVVLCMDGLKTARLAYNPDHMDSVYDKVAYSAIYGEVVAREEVEPFDPDTGNAVDEEDVYVTTEELDEFLSRYKITEYRSSPGEWDEPTEGLTEPAQEQGAPTLAGEPEKAASEAPIGSEGPLWAVEAGIIVPKSDEEARRRAKMDQIHENRQQHKSASGWQVPSGVSAGKTGE
jgi:hypothetical protein